MNSQNDEEQLIHQYFGSYTGTLLDIGANDGITLSNSYAALQRGWRGILVEPARSVYDTLLKNMAGLDTYCLNVAIGQQRGTQMFWESGTHLNKGDKALLSTLEQTHSTMWNCDFTQVEVDVITIAELLAMFPNITLDLISIDAEGLDLQILHQIDLTAVGCKMLIIEHEHSDIQAMKHYCQLHGMRMMKSNHQNLIMIR